jgi:hypothetical protein
MSKKKNTLKDLDEFLKQQAASLVSPEKLNITKEEKKEEEPVQLSESTPVKQETAVVQATPAGEPTFHDVLEQLKSLAKKTDYLEFRKKMYDMLLSVMDAQHHQVPEDKIFINTLLYLKHGQRWKDGIREYWQHHE